MPALSLAGGVRLDTRAGHYEREFQTKAGEVTLQMPKLRSLPFETANPVSTFLSPHQIVLSAVSVVLNPSRLYGVKPG